jgi:hypothetical protein
MQPEGSPRHVSLRFGNTRAFGAASIIVLVCSSGATAQGPAGGTNVNVVAGTGQAGDWTLQRQNEPSMACSSRNPRNCIAGANDYRTVDIPFPADASKETGDAWLGWYTTKDGGLTWRSRLLPGFPQDSSPLGLASPLKGYAAGADPVIRTGTNGLFYYAGLAFNREEGAPSAIFVTRFIDNNNLEGIGDDPIAYLGTSIVDRVDVLSARRGAGGRGRGGAIVAGGRGAGRGRTSGRAVAAGAAQGPSSTRLLDKPVRRPAPLAGTELTCPHRALRADGCTSSTRSSTARVPHFAGASCSRGRQIAA